MKWRCNPVGAIVTAVGVCIILAIILPSVFWWIFLGAALICIGIGMIRKR